MGYYDRQYGKQVSLAQANNSLITLAAINLIIFVILIFIQAVYYLQSRDTGTALMRFNENVLSLFALPAAGSAILERPWTILTHMFVHVDVWHILGNMLWLWLFGYIFQDLTGSKKIIPVYIYGALAGALSFILAYNFLPALQPQLAQQQALGASAGVMAIAVATTTLSPGYRIFPMLNGGIPIWIITVLYLIIDLASIPVGNTGGHIAHLAGGLMGFLFIFSFQRGMDLGGWMNNFFDWVNNLFNPDKPVKGKTIKQELFYKADVKPYSRTPNITEQRIDEILDKINTAGYESLTTEEKELLQRAAKDDQV